jgi:hypothetical protein
VKAFGHLYFSSVVVVVVVVVVDIDTFVNCNWVDTRWQQYSTVQYTFTHKQYAEQHS